MTQDRNRATLFFIGILVCVPVLALYQFGLLTRPNAWLQEQLARLLVLPSGGLKTSLFLQYGFYTLLAFVCAWMGLELRAVRWKLAFLIALSYLTVGLTFVLAWNGVLFEPFSGLIAAWTAGVMGMVFAVGEQKESTGPVSADEASPEPAIEG